MRIIGGNLKGKKINFFKSQTTRPLKDSVKESIFNILNHSNNIEIEIKNSKVLDLYAGTGSFGIECISRGAKTVTFVERNIIFYKLLEENLKNLSIFKQTKIINNNVENDKIIPDEKYNLIFFDPPYKNTNFVKTLATFKKEKKFNRNHILIIHREVRSGENFNDLIQILDERSYGRSRIIFAKFI